MPRIRTLNIVLAPVLLLTSLLLLWFTLPFPPIVADFARAEYIQAVLQSGSSLTTIHKPGSSFRKPHQPPSRDDQEPYPNFQSGVFNAVILSWQLHRDPAVNAISLQLGTPLMTDTVPDFGGTVNLTELAVKTPGFLTNEVYMWAPAGDQDGVSLPYFDYADATLIYHQAIATWQAVHLRFLVPATGVVQVWKDMPRWDTFDAEDIAFIDEDDKSRGLLATFDLSAVVGKASKSLKDIKIRDFDGMLPTKTYAIRRLILALLKPVASSTSTAVDRVEPMFHLVGQALKLLLLSSIGYFVVVVICWMVWGSRRPFTTWIRNFWLTRRIHRYIMGPPPPSIWGPSGPLEGEDEEKGHRREPEGRIIPVTGIVSFFTSSSPLDSLLASFENTRWMVLPIRSTDTNSVLIDKARGTSRSA